MKHESIAVTLGHRGKDQIEHLCWQCLLGCETTRGLPRKSVLTHQGVSVQAGQLWGGKGGWSCKG